MKETDKQLENLTKNIFNDTGLETPSLGFTASVISQIKVLESVVTYKPLINKTGWFFIVVIFLALTMLLVFATKAQSLGALSVIDFSVLTDNKITNVLSSFSISKTTTYAIALFGLMFFIQIPILKNYLDKRLEL